MNIVYQLISAPLHVHVCAWQLLIKKCDDDDDDDVAPIFTIIIDYAVYVTGLVCNRPHGTVRQFAI